MFRHEYKYLITSEQLAILKNRAELLLLSDIHTSDNSDYYISSLYYDDYNNSCFYDNENGIDPREKFRIRIYNNSVESIKLELKRKEKGKTLKYSSLLTFEQANKLISQKCEDSWIASASLKFCSDELKNVNSNKLISKLLEGIKTRFLKPVIIVEYKRTPFVYPLGNVRITFDTNITSSKNVEDFFENRKRVKRSVLPIGMHLMEVKFDEFIPDFIHRSFNLENLSLTNFSKYYLARKFQLI